jgi:UPF0755 protein
MLRVFVTFLLLSALTRASLADDLKTKDPAHPSPAVPQTDQRPYGALPAVAPEKNKPKTPDALTGRLLQLGATRLAVDALNASPHAAPNGARQSRAFDASEGTALDPLRNDTFDLTHPHDVPSLK